MGPDKIENEFKSQMDQREIQPSPVAWDRLDAMLTAAESKKQKPKFNWMYIAASLIGFFMLGYVFYNNSGESVEVSSTKAVVKNEAKPTTTPAKKEQQPPIPSQKATQVIAEKSVVSPKKDASFSSNLLGNAAQSTNVTVEQIDQTNNLSITNETHLIAPNQNLNESQLTDIATKTVNPHVKVNASNLLSEVDKELTLSFREKVIRKIDKNYKTVKLALINRNQQ
jgi:Rps23 Pro-64 3,4-dihydroxylase Tpa1-like proline 4-hydroxylase